ncbi:MAG: glycosyltransferase [Anaerolineales bacterium]
MSGDIEAETRHKSETSAVGRHLQDRRQRLSVASLVWKLPFGLHEAQGEVIQELGHTHTFFFANNQLPPNAQVILVQGPYGSLEPLARQLLNTPKDRRPVLIYWFQQSLDLSRPYPASSAVTSVFSDLRNSLGTGQRRPGLMRRAIQIARAGRGARIGYLGDIRWLHQNGLLDVLVLSSTCYAEYLAERGIYSLVVARGHHESYGTDLGLSRDIAAVWMGKLRTKRRAKAVRWLQRELETQGHELRIYDGEHRKFIYGEERTRVLNRAYFVPNIYFSSPSDELSIRYYIAAANGAVVITEPGLNQYRFDAGSHFVECPLEKMPERICYYVEQEDLWRQLSTNVGHLVREELTLSSSIEQMLNRASSVLFQRD